MRNRVAIACLGLFMCVASLPGAASAGEAGRIRAQSFAVLPEDQTIMIQPQDDSADNLEIGRSIAATLAQSGVKPVASGGRLLLTFTTDVVAADEGGGGLTLGDTGASEATERVVTAPQGDGPQIVAPEPHIPQGVGRQILDSDIRVNVWSSSRDSLLQGRAPGSERASTPRYILSAILFDAQTGRQFWRGESALDGASVNDLATFKSMVPALFGAFGRDARNEQFRVD